MSPYRLLPFLVILLCGVSPCSNAQASSLFYTPEERAQIELEVQKTPPDQTTRAKYLLHLGSILYYGEDDWAIWLQNKKWTAATQAPNIKIESVSPSSVVMSVKIQNGTQLHNVVLRSHQSLDLLTGRVVEGFAY